MHNLTPKVNLSSTLVLNKTRCREDKKPGGELQPYTKRRQVYFSKEKITREPFIFKTKNNIKHRCS